MFGVYPLFMFVIRIKPADIMLGCIAMASNLFSIVHCMHSGSMTNKAQKLDNALQKFAMIVAKFAKALAIQETYLDQTKSLLDYLDLLLDSRIHDFKQKLLSILHLVSSNPVAETKSNKLTNICTLFFYFIFTKKKNTYIK
ncbi:hypothetical protein RFI_07990 [Reticulomyxa filosa]|uniref:Uncharacterized protein n=1 Tax=Reticulomyxa filosa TaxID=46433 RepID=X6NSZ1_RETFI|nr:hypothetical protein RFI_07990 [Reticulomyxa filosa]|eukprot:ETO29136.1 hypothetical protein RFI_07990 [Reticulomyxa filosa]